MSDGLNNPINLQRQHFLDWLRVSAFALLIFYHTGMMFVSWGFHIESGHNSIFLKSIMMLTSNWRLDVLFLVSGVAISIMAQKMSLGKFAWQRVIKLLIPLLFAVAVVVAPQAYYEALQKGVYQGGFWEFWLDVYFSFSWDKRMDAPFPTYNHMWYVVYLFVYTLVLLPFLAFLNGSPGIAALKKIECSLLKPGAVLLLPIAFYILNASAFSNHESNHALLDDWYGHSIYGFALVAGITLARLPNLWLSFEKLRVASLTLAVLTYLILLLDFLVDVNPMEQLIPQQHYGSFIFIVELIMKWSWIAMLLGFSKHYLNFSNAFLSYSNKAVYPVFILHQTIIIMIGYQIFSLNLNAVVEYFVIVIATFISCILLYEFPIKRFRVSRLMFGLSK